MQAVMVVMVYQLGLLGVLLHLLDKMFQELIIMLAVAVVAVVTAQTQLADMVAEQVADEQVLEHKHLMQLQTQAVAVAEVQFTLEQQVAVLL
jgi:hypothetical protein